MVTTIMCHATFHMVIIVTYNSTLLVVSIVKGFGVFHIALSGSRGALRVAIILNPKPVISGPRPHAAASSLMLGPRESVLNHV